ncbi:hypothetical protein PIB30_109805, partial [Stylosanthes scabra]|nr:hypothetical protein [Stylosanthes scabra]
RLWSLPRTVLASIPAATTIVTTTVPRVATVVVCCVYHWSIASPAILWPRASSPNSVCVRRCFCRPCVKPPAFVGAPSVLQVGVSCSSLLSVVRLA